jgi:hypothetical protein
MGYELVFLQIEFAELNDSTFVKQQKFATSQLRYHIFSTKSKQKRALGMVFVLIQRWRRLVSG